MPRISLRKIAYKPATFIVLTLLIVSGLSFNLSLSHADNLSIDGPTNCDNNAVIYCGTSSANSLINKYNNGDSVNSAASIHHIYSYFGISSTDINDMNGSATNEIVEVGTVNKDGNVYDGNGKLIADQAVTAGRVEGNNASGNQAEGVDGTNFFVRKPSVSFQSNTLSAYVVLINNQFAFAILSSCGNPVIATPIVTPTPKPKPVPTPMPKPTTKAPTKTTLNYCSGNTSNSNSAVASQGGNCSQNTTVVQTPPPAPPTPTPFGQCTSLSLDVVSTSPLEVSVTANPTTGNGAQLQNVVFNFGDGTVTSASSQTTASHTYATPGNYNISATLSFTGNGQSVPSATCQAELTSTSPPPVVTTASTPPTTPTVQAQAQTTTPATTPLVNTGPGNIVALFGASSLIGMVGYRILIARYLKFHQ